MEMESFREEEAVMGAHAGIDDAAVEGKSAANWDGLPDEEAIRNETAAVEVQRIYRGYRVRRNLADAATMAHKFGWWNVVEGAVLEYNSANFYAYNTPQNAAQRWLRLKKKAAKVGKGLSKNEKARKLALQHWLEAIDPKHRYGHNLHFYYGAWSNTQTREPFFYWLDIGEGKNFELEKCKRSKLQKDLIRYLSPNERKWFEVVVENGKLIHKMSRRPVNTPKGEKWIFVMSTSGKLYVGKKEKGTFQHSSFLAGGATTAAGRLLVKDGMIQLMEAHSGHYHPTPENFDQLISILTSHGADLTLARVQFVSDDMLSTKSNSAKSLAVDSAICLLDTSLALEGVQQEHLTSKDAAIQEMSSLSLIDEERTSGMVDKATSAEKTVPTEAENKDGVVIEGLEFLQPGGCFDGGSICENLQGMKVEILKPGKTSQVESQTEDERTLNISGEDATSKSTSVSPHELFAPAAQTFIKLEDRADSCSSDWEEERTGNTAQLTHDSKVYLLRSLSHIRPTVTPS